MRNESSGGGLLHHAPLQQTLHHKGYSPERSSSTAHELPPEYYTVAQLAHRLDSRAQEVLHYNLCQWLSDSRKGGISHG